jgi:glycosyltransferase involved in cell wall biosynthesis
MEVIVVDGGSADRTHEIALEFQRAAPALYRIHRQNDEDSAAMRSAGLALARGEYAAFCGADERLPPDRLGELYEICEKTGSPSAGEKLWRPALRGALARREFLLAHGLPVKTGYDRAEQLAAYDTLRNLIGPEELPLFCSDWICILRGICLQEYRAGKGSAAFFEKMIALAGKPQAEDAIAHADRPALDRAHRKFYDAFAGRDWIGLEKKMKHRR